MENTKIYFTALFITTLILFSFNFFKEEKKIYSNEENDLSRNERSTPRTFILPATPAVALIQEKKKKLWKKEFIMKKCMLRLHDLNYKINNFENMDDISVFIAILRFQKLNSLNITGEINVETSKKLGCEI